jgi:hypothetical protein
MYWDVVEVKPEPGYRLFVRFRDGTQGHLQFAVEELTGVLSPLVDVDFFNRVFIDQGAVTWPGEIDLAPDAMYAGINPSGLPFLKSPDAGHPSVYRSAIQS